MCLFYSIFFSPLFFLKRIKLFPDETFFFVPVKFLCDSVTMQCSKLFESLCYVSLVFPSSISSESLSMHVSIDFFSELSWSLITKREGMTSEHQQILSTALNQWANLGSGDMLLLPLKRITHQKWQTHRVMRKSDFLNRACVSLMKRERLITRKDISPGNTSRTCSVKERIPHQDSEWIFSAS